MYGLTIDQTKQMIDSMQHNDLRPGYELNMTSKTAPNPRFMRFLDGDNDDYKNYQALCRGDPLRVRLCFINYILSPLIPVA